MAKILFQSNDRPTVGVELEFALVDARTMELISACPAILKRLPDELRQSVKPELMQCYIEINSGIGETIEDVRRDLRNKIEAVEKVADDLGTALYWSGSHPFSSWRDQQPTHNERYARLLDSLQDIGRQLVTFGLHVHVGVDSGDKAVMICDRIMRYLPLFIALSCNSPWWEGRVTGLESHRSKIMEALPTAGLPPLMRNWSEYAWLLNHLEETGFIHSIRDIWWFVRPHHKFGTVEVRVCDMPGRLDDAIALAAVAQCLVSALSEEIDEGTYQHDSHPMLVRQNMWRAERFGLDALLIDSQTLQPCSARDMLLQLIDRLSDTAAAIGAQAGLEQARTFAEGETWARRQLAALEETGDQREAVRKMLQLSRIGSV
jgi:carboxylate-amine ligase